MLASAAPQQPRHRHRPTVLSCMHLLVAQGIDLKAGGRNKKKHRTAPKSENVYLKLLVKVRHRSAGTSLAPRRPALPSARLCPTAHPACSHVSACLPPSHPSPPRHPASHLHP